MVKSHGSLIVFYGVNNVGKTTQARLLLKALQDQERKARMVKYPIHDLAPTGRIINEYLREGNPHSISKREAQILYAMNRTHFEPTLREYLSDGEIVIAEDYTGTGIAWGMSGGIDKAFLTEINQHLLDEHVGIYLEGERYLVGREEGHMHETDDERMSEMKEIFDELAEDFSWNHVMANRPISDVHSDVLKIIDAHLESMGENIRP
jgi:thymidylate kinase